MSTGKRLTISAAAATIVFGCVVFDMALHRLFTWVFDFNYFDNGLPPSLLVRNGTFPIAAFLGFCAMFGFLALIYLRSRSELGGSRVWAGQRFFAPIALIMFFGVLESAFVFPTPFRSEIITAVADAVPYVLLGGLLGWFVPSGEKRGHEMDLAPWQSMLWIALIYVAGRYLVSYPILHIVSGYVDRATGTLVWTIACGLSMGAFYWLAGSTFSAATPMQKALRVGGYTLGVFWLMVQLFYALIFAVSVSDLIIRGTADSVYLVVGIYSFEKLFRRSSSAGTRLTPHPDSSDFRA
jgi:hypothetical protein